MTHEGFEKWLEGLKTAWETKNPQMAADLCAENVLYYETPFDAPLKSREEVLHEWEHVPTGQKDITFNYKILSVSEDLGINHWTAAFTRIPSGEKVSLDGVFMVKLDSNNQCTEFHQWRFSQVT